MVVADPENPKACLTGHVSKKGLLHFQQTLRLHHQRLSSDVPTEVMLDPNQFLRHVLEVPAMVAKKRPALVQHSPSAASSSATIAKGAHELPPVSSSSSKSPQSSKDFPTLSSTTAHSVVAKPCLKKSLHTPVESKKIVAANAASSATQAVTPSSSATAGSASNSGVKTAPANAAPLNCLDFASFVSILEIKFVPYFSCLDCIEESLCQHPIAPRDRQDPAERDAVAQRCCCSQVEATLVRLHCVYGLIDK